VCPLGAGERQFGDRPHDGPRDCADDGCLPARKCHFKDVKLVFRINENDARKNTFHVDQRILQHLPKIDKVVYVSTWLSDYFKSRGALNTNNKVILNGVDRSVFKPSNKFENGKINVMTCHWSDNYLKGQDYVEFMDDFVATSDEFTFTYIGRTKANLKHSSLVQPLFGKFLADEIAKYDLCINASRFDPGPNIIISTSNKIVPRLTS
jgi:hypothetical protein